MDLSLPHPLDGVMNLALNGQSAAARTLLENSLQPHPCEAARWFVVAKLLLADETTTRQTIMQALVKEATPQAAALVSLLDVLAEQEHHQEMKAILAKLERLADRMVGTTPPPIPAEKDEEAETTQEYAAYLDIVEETTPPPEEGQPVTVCSSQEYAILPAIVEEATPASPPSPSAERVLDNLQFFLDRLVTPRPVSKESAQEQAQQAIGHLETFLERVQTFPTRLALARMEQFLERIQAALPVATTP